VILINDPEANVSSTVLKFADDIKMFCPAVSTADHEQIQRNQYINCKWADQWNMKNKVYKCKVIRYGRNFSDTDPFYLMYNVPIKKEAYV